jgi:hypothetical protein
VSKRGARLREYYKVRAKIFVRTAWENPLTVYCPVMAAIGIGTGNERIAVDQVHHKRGRLGPLLIDERHWLAVSQKGHDLIHANPVLARAHGWLCAPGQWNTSPKDAETDRLRGVIAGLRK